MLAKVQKFAYWVCDSAFPKVQMQVQVQVYHALGDFLLVPARLMAL